MQNALYERIWNIMGCPETAHSLGQTSGKAGRLCNRQSRRTRDVPKAQRFLSRVDHDRQGPPRCAGGEKTKETDNG